jgi:hypothetical protein
MMTSRPTTRRELAGRDARRGDRGPGMRLRLHEGIALKLR